MKLIRDKPAISHSAVLTVAGSLAAALILSAVVVPASIAAARPDFVALMLIFWCWHRPEYIGLWVAFLIGLLSDVMHFVVLGENALAYILVVYLAKLCSARLRGASAGVRMLVVLLLLTVDTTVANLMHVKLHGADAVGGAWLSPIAGVAVWAVGSVTLGRLIRE